MQYEVCNAVSERWAVGWKASTCSLNFGAYDTQTDSNLKDKLPPLDWGTVTLRCYTACPQVQLLGNHLEELPFNVYGMYVHDVTEFHLGEPVYRLSTNTSVLLFMISTTTWVIASTRTPADDQIWLRAARSHNIEDASIKWQLVTHEFF